MAKQSIAFRKKIPFDEYILALKCYMSKYKIQHVTGLCDAEILNRELDEAAITELTEQALKNGLFVKQKDALYLQHEIEIFLAIATHSKHVVTIHKPSYSTNKLITFFYHGGHYGATVQDAAKNSILLLADPNLDLLYELVASEIHAKDINRKFDLKKLRKISADKGLDNVFTVKHEYQLVAYSAENKTGKQMSPALMFNVGRNEYELLTGDLETGILTKYSDEAIDEHLKDYIVKICKIDETNQNDQETTNVHTAPASEDPEPYTQFSFRKLISSESFPKSFFQLLKSFGTGFIENLKHFKFSARTVIKLIFVLLSAAFFIFLNLYCLCYKNDTFMLDTRSYLGKATAYLFGGELKYRHGITSLSIAKNMQNTTGLVQPLYFLLNMLLTCAVGTVVSGKLPTFFRNIFGFRGKWKLYRKALDKPISYYFWTSVLIAAPVGLFLFNPFTAAVLALIFLFSALKGDDSNMAVSSMIFRSALSCKKVAAGKKQAPTFASGIVRIWTFGMALTLYSAVNLLVWKLFDFNYWIRVVFTVLLMVAALFRLGIIRIEKPSKAQKAAALICFILAGAVIALASSGAVPVFADDGGWSESGRTIAGLMNNSGWPIILGFSLVIGLAAFSGAAIILGATAGTAALIAGAAGGAAMLWSSATETGEETAYDFMLGKYSPYGGDSPLAGMLNDVIGYVPFVGNAWKAFSNSRDATYDFSNGNYAEGIFETISAGFGVVGLCGEIAISMNGVPDSIAADANLTPNNNGQLEGTSLNGSGFNSQIYTPVEYEGTVKVNGEIRDVSRKVYQRNDIDINYYDKTTGLTNLERMKAGKPPIGPDGNPIQLHHVIQKEGGPMVEIQEMTHQQYTSQLHGLVGDGESFRNDPILNKQYNNFRNKYWKWRAAQFVGGN